MVTTRATKNKIKATHEDAMLLRAYCHRAKNLYNSGLFHVRQAFFNKEKYPGYKKVYEALKQSQDFALMHANTGQQVLRKVDADMKSFFKNLTAAKTDADGRKVRPPRYKDKAGYASLYLQKNEGFRVKNRMIYVSLPSDLKKSSNRKFLAFPTPANLFDEEITFVEISSSRDGKKFYLSACRELEVSSHDAGEHVMALDLGVNNLIAQVDTASGEAILHTGRQIKSINQHLNKTVAFLKSEAEKKNAKKSTRRIEGAFEKRNAKIRDHMHKLAKIHLIVSHARRDDSKNIKLEVLMWFSLVAIGFSSLLAFICSNEGATHTASVSSISGKAESQLARVNGLALRKAMNS